MEHSFVLCWNTDISESWSEIPFKFLDVVLEKNGEDPLDWPGEKWITTSSQGEEEHPTYNKTKEG